MDTALIAAMKPGQEYTSRLLADITDRPQTEVCRELKEATQGGVVTRTKKKGVRGYVYTTNQLRFEYEEDQEACTTS